MLGIKGGEQVYLMFRDNPDQETAFIDCLIKGGFVPSEENKVRVFTRGKLVVHWFINSWSSEILVHYGCELCLRFSEGTVEDFIELWNEEFISL